MANKRGKRRSSDRLFSWAPKSVDSNCSHEIQRHLLFGRKAMTNLDNTLKSKDITLPTKVCIVTAMIFLVGLYRCEIKNAEHQRIDAFDLQCWKRLMRDPWSAGRSNQSIL